MARTRGIETGAGGKSTDAGLNGGAGRKAASTAPGQPNRRRVLTAVAAGSVGAVLPAAWAQAAWPSRAVSLVVGFPPGGQTDFAGRVVADKIQAALGKPCVIENKAGVNGNIAAQEILRAKPDGYRLLVGNGAMTIMPHVEATGILVHTPVTHGHIITVLAHGKQKITKEMALDAFEQHPRIRVVSTDEGFLGNASLFKYARDLGNARGDMYEIGLWSDSIVESGDDIMYAINIPQESVTIPETIDAIRAACGMQPTRETGTAKTNEYLNIGRFK